MLEHKVLLIQNNYIPSLTFQIQFLLVLEDPPKEQLKFISQIQRYQKGIIVNISKISRYVNRNGQKHRAR